MGLDNKSQKNKKFFSFKKKDSKVSTKEQRIAFFLFYFVFFLVIFLFVFNKSSVSSNTQAGDSPESESSTVIIPNYNFEYKIELDNNTYSYSGKRLYKDELFTYIENDIKISYYKRNDKYYKKDGDIWVEDVSPYKYNMFLDADSVDYLFYNAEEVNTKESNNIKTFFYTISNSSLSNSIDGSFLEDGDVTNDFIVSFNLKSNKIEKIEMQLDSFGRAKEIAAEKFRITLKYSNFGNIKEIKNPME